MKNTEDKGKAQEIRVLFAGSGPIADAVSLIMEETQISEKDVGKVLVVMDNGTTEIMTGSELQSKRKLGGIYGWQNIGLRDVNYFQGGAAPIRMGRFNVSVSTEKLRSAIMGNQHVCHASKVLILDALEEASVFTDETILLLYLGAVFGAMSDIVAPGKDVSVIMQSLYLVEP